MGGPSLPSRTNLAFCFNLLPRLVGAWISESESDSGHAAWLATGSKPSRRQFRQRSYQLRPERSSSSWPLSSQGRIFGLATSFWRVVRVAMTLKGLARSIERGCDLDAPGGSPAHNGARRRAGKQVGVLALGSQREADSSRRI